MALSNKTILFRCDASDVIGTGHLVRCLTLADEAISRGWKIVLVSRNSGDIFDKLSLSNKYNCRQLNSTIDTYKNPDIKDTYSDWLDVTQQTDAYETLLVVEEFQPFFIVVDHYALDFRWHGIIRRACKELMVIDDLGNRQLNCTFLLDQNFGSKRSKYANKLLENTSCMFGPNFALLRKEFQQLRDLSLVKRENVKFPKKILITMGGVDACNYSLAVVQRLAKSEFSKDCNFTIVVGAAYQHTKNLKSLIKDTGLKVEIMSNVTNMAAIMSQADLCIGAAGSTSWERCCLGLPTIMLAIAENQIEIAKNLHVERLAFFSSLENLQADFELFFEANGTKIMQELTYNSQLVCDGMGAKRVIDQLEMRYEN